MAKEQKAKTSQTITSPRPKAFNVNVFSKSYSVVVFCFAFLLFTNSIFNGYNLDDELVTRNHRLTSKGISAIPEIFTSPYYEDAQGYAYEYRPVVLSSFAVEYSLFGERPWISHLINLLLYAVCSVLLFQIFSKLLSGYHPFIPLAITLLYTAHSSHTEVVCGIKNRDEILAFLFALVALQAAVRFIETTQWWRILLVAAFFTIALMSKATIVSFVLVIPLALILFKSGKPFNVLAVTITILFPTYFLLNIGSGFSRIVIIAAMLSMVVVMLTVANWPAPLQILRQFVAYLTFPVTEGKSDYAVVKRDWGIPSLLVPSVKIVKPVPIILATVLTVVYMLFLHGGFVAWSVLPFAILSVLYWRGNESVSWFAFLAICICLNYNCIYLPPQSGYREKYLNFLYPFYGILIFNSGSVVMSIAIVALIGLFPFTPTLVSLWDGLSSVFAMFLLRVKYLRIVLIGVMLWFALAPTLFNGRMADTLSYMLFGTGVITILCLHFKPSLFKYLLWMFAAFALGYFISLQNESKATLIHVGTLAVIEAADRVNPQVVKRQDRPLHYTEVCVTAKEAMTFRAGTSLEILFHYLKKTVLPYPLAYYYGYKFIRPMKLTDTVPLVSLLIYLVIVLTAFYLIRKNPLISFGLFTYFFSVIVFSNFTQYVPGMVADRYLLVPSWGWSVVIAGILSKSSRISDNTQNVTWASIQPTAKYLTLALLLLYSTLTFARNFNWKDDLTLFRHDIGYVDESAQAHNLLALHLMQHSSVETNSQKQIELANEALIHFKRTLEIYPPFFNVAYDIGRVYMALNKPDSAIVAFENALSIDSLTLPTVYSTLANLYFEKGDTGRFVQRIQKFIQLQPNDYTGYGVLSYYYYQNKRLEESIEVNKQAINNIPNLVDPYINVSRVFAEVGKRDSAIIYLQRANAMVPGNQSVQNALKQLN